METIEKIYNVKKMKEDIKVAVDYQRFLKNQRKTVNKNCRKQGDPDDIDPKDAAWKHWINREKLSVMYVTYGVMRGKDIDEQIATHISKKEEYSIENLKKRIDEILEDYKLKEVEYHEM